MEQNINAKFDEKIKELEENLPKMTVGVNCAELTLTNILDVLGINNGNLKLVFIYFLFFA